MSIKIFKTALTGLVIILTSILGYSQKVEIEIDKTTAEMRQIITNEVDWYGTGRDDKASMYFFSFFGENPISFYIFDMNWDEDQKFREGYKALFKHASGAFTEITCVDEDGRSSLEWKPIPIVNIHSHALYYITEEQVVSITKDPVVKIRIEYDKGYLDIDCARKDGTSRFSDYVKKAYNVIEQAKKNKTGLYDNF